MTERGPYDGKIGMALLDRPAAPKQIELVKRLEELGYDSAWICETRLARDAISMLGAFAATTERITLGPSVVNSWTRGPALMAMTLATLNELAPGRIAFGVGAYWDPLAWKQGIDRSKPLTQMREYVGVVKRLLALEEGVTLEGDVVHVRDLTLDLGHGAPREPIDAPVYIGATGPKMMELSGKIADGVLLNGLMSVDYARQSIERVKAGAEAAGRDMSEIDLPQMINVAVSEDGESARQHAHRLVTMYLGQQPHIGKASGLDEDHLERIKRTVGGWPARPGGIDEAMKLVDESIVDRLTVSGTPDHCRRRLWEWIDAGASYPIIVPLSDNYDELCDVFAPNVRSAH